MKISLFLFIYFLHEIQCSENELDLKKYMDVKAEVVREKLLRRARNHDDFYDVKFNHINNITLIANYSSGEVFTFFETPYALLDQDLYKISQNTSIFYTFLPNQTARFLEATKHKTIGFVTFVTNSNVLHIIGFSTESQKFFKIQNIIYSNISQVIFFKLQNQLYLIVSTNTEALIYKFLESHFDEVEKIHTHASFHTFTADDRQIIIALRKTEATSDLYEFKNDSVKKILKIRTNKPEQALNYFYQRKRYVIIFGEASNVEIYLWTDDDLLLLDKITTSVALTGKKDIYFVDNIPYLVCTNNNNFLIFSLLNNQFVLIHNSGLSTTKTLWSYGFIPYQNFTNAIAILGPSVEGRNAIITITSISITANPKHEKVVEENNKLSTCFDNLEKAVYVFRNQLKTANRTKNELVGQKREEFSVEDLNSLKSKLAAAKDLVKSRNSSVLIIHSPVINFPLNASKVVASNIIFDQINNKNWQPNRWLSYSRPQYIAGLVKSRVIRVKSLNINNNKSIFNEVLLSKGNQMMSGSVSVRNLKARKIETSSLNKIAMKNIYYKSQPVNIQGLKRFPTIRADSIQAERINEMDENTFMPILSNQNLPKLDLNLKVDNLWVKSINGVNFTDFKNSVFRKGITDTIRGNLTFANLTANRMNFERVSGRSSFLTTSTDQIINSSITISKMFIQDVETDRINGIDFGNSVATTGDNIISGPVSIRRLHVRNDLELKGKIDKEFLQFNDTHIVGTNESDFLQIYNGKVKIRGDLFIKDLNLGKSGRVYVSGSEFRDKFSDFWSKKMPQKIATHFEVKTGVSTSHLFATFVNNVAVNDYMLNSTQQRKPAKFYFDSVTVKGNVFLNPDEQHSPDLRQIEKNAVKLNGTYYIKGQKTYTDVLTVDNLEIARINGSSPRKIDNLIIKGDLYVDNITVETVNNVQLQHLLENSLFVDKPQNISKLDFENVTVNKLFVNTLNGQNMQQISSSIDNINNLDHIKVCHVEGDVKFRNVRNLSTINGHTVDALMQRSLSKYNNGTVFGPVKFSGNVKITDLHAIIINEVDFEKETKRNLYKAWNQTLTQHFTFNKIKTENLITEQINDFNTRNLIDVSSKNPQHIHALNGLKFLEITNIMNLLGRYEYDIEDCFANLKMPPTQVWNHLIITGNATFWDQQSIVNDILQNVVTTKHNHVITGQVTFSDHISAKNVTALRTINDINLQEIIDDAFLNNPNTKQVVTGRKSFIRLEAESVRSLQNTDVSRINNIPIREINEKIVKRNSIGPITGSKVFFGGLQTNKIKTDVISGITAQNLVSYESNQTIPDAIFESVRVINNLGVKFVNNMPLEVVLEERLLKQSAKQILTGNYFFRHVKFTENMYTPRINDVTMSNVIYDIEVQEIESPKRFVENLKIVGDAQIDFLNGLELSKIYEQAVLQNEETNFTGTVVFLNPTTVNGNIETNYINNIPMSYMTDTTARQPMESEAERINEIKGVIANFVAKHIKATQRMPTELMYLEKSSDLQIPVSNALSARIVEIKNHLLMHVESEESGTACGLPTNCTCPVQQTVQISNSVTPISNKGNQRIYSYYGNGMNMQLVTTSISTDSFCRTSKMKATNEVSHLTWNTIPYANNTGAFFIHQTFFTGYISGVEFFTLYGRTYVLIGKYYDPVADTHAVNCLVLRFNDDKTALEEIQNIPTQGLKTMSLLFTAQGVVLILGNMFNNSDTRIFRFDHDKQQFKLLREVPTFASVFAEGVVLGTDSLIVLANEHSLLYILKYVEEFDNYYFYQNLLLDHPVSSLSVFYAEDFGISDAYLCVVTRNGRYFMYSFQFIQGWKMESTGQLEGMKGLIPFKLNTRSYLFAPSSKSSYLLAVVEHDSD